jgi:hypothetical protein
LASTSNADSRSIGVSYLPPTGERAHRGAFLVGDRAEAAAGRGDHRALDRHRHAALLQGRDERFADAKLCDRLGHVDLRIRREGFRSGLDRFLVARRERAQRVLDAIAHLTEDDVGHVVGILRAEIHADTFRANQTHDLLDALAQRGRRVVEQQVRFVEEEHELGLVEIADLGEFLEQFREHPEQEGRVELGLENELVGGEDVDDAAAGQILAHEVGEIECGFAEERVAAGLFEREQRALDRRDRCRRDQAVVLRDLLGVIGRPNEQRAQVFEVEQEQAVVVGGLEHDFEHAGLRVVEFEQAREQRRAHFRHRCAHGMAGVAVDVPEHDGIRARLPGETELVDARLELVVHRAGLRESGEIALHVGEEHGHAEFRKPSAMSMSETDFPVPVAPATMPWRFAYCGSRTMSLPSPLPSRMSFKIGPQCIASMAERRL